MLPSPHISVAPMMDWTDRHCRFFHRIIAPHAQLYTEMISTGAILFGDRKRHMAFHPAEHPLALQLGGNDPAALAECAKIAAEDYGYDEINLNCGCPSDRVQNGAFGACLMKEPATVARCIEAMNRAIHIPVTVKCRIGVDDCEERIFLNQFIKSVSEAGCKTFVIHARKALLKGLSPKENREIPPLRYDIATEIKQRYRPLTIVLNGGITAIDQIETHLAVFDGVMIGREAYRNPYFLTRIEQVFFSGTMMSRDEIALAMIPYIEEQQRLGVPVHSITHHMLGLFHGVRGGKHWRQILSNAPRTDSINIEALFKNALMKQEESLPQAA